AIMFQGGSLARCHVSGAQLFRPNQMKYGTFKPVCKTVPAEASISRKANHNRWSSKPACTIIDLLTNPLKSGKAEMERPPIKVNTNVHGIRCHSPPSSVNLLRPVMKSTVPQPMKRSPL